MLAGDQMYVENWIKVNMIMVLWVMVYKTTYRPRISLNGREFGAFIFREVQLISSNRLEHSWIWNIKNLHIKELFMCIQEMKVVDIEMNLFSASAKTIITTRGKEMIIWNELCVCSIDDERNQGCWLMLFLNHSNHS